MEAKTREVEPKPAKKRLRLGSFFTKRRLLTWWLPAGFIALCAIIAFNWASVRTETLTRADALRTAVIDLPEFAVTELEVSGHSQLSVHQIGAIVGIEPGTRSISSLRFDAKAARAALLENPWIERASVAVDPSGVMKIDILERTPVAMWRGDDGFFLIDTHGTPIIPVDGPESRLDLPLLIGENANEAVGDARALLRAAPAAILPEISALVRRGGRRWDVISSRGIVLKLPADDPLGALRSYMDRRIGERIAPFAVVAVDLRLPTEPPVIRLEPGASEMRDDLLRTLRTTYR
jgi:cell division protein FtsQ